jgi:hypothetical protein
MKLTAASWRMGCLVVWGAGVLCLLALAVALFVVRPDPSQWLAGLKPKSACDPAQLSIGGMTLRIQELARSADGSIPFPADGQGSAYWIEGTTPHYVIALSPAIENLKLVASVKEGDVARITWTDCSSAAYAIRAVEVTTSHASDLFDKPGVGLTVFVQADASGTGVALRSDLVQAFAAPVAASASTEAAVNPVAPGEATEAMPAPPGEPTEAVMYPTPPGEPIEAVMTPAMPAPPEEVQPSPTTGTRQQTTATRPPASTSIPADTPIPPPSAGEVEAEIGFQDKQVTDASITLIISVYNYGDRAFSVSLADVHLLPPNQGPVSPSSVDPALPYQVAAGATRDFTFTFPNPGGSGIVFQLFSVEFNLDDF